MRVLIGCMALLGLLFLAGAEARGDETSPGDKHEQMLERLNGKWKIVAGVNQGKKLGKEQLNGSQVIIENGRIVVLDPDEKEMYKAKFQLNVSTTPFQIDMVSDMPTLPKSLAVGIFEFRPEGWRLCYGLPGGKRPEKFASPEGSQLMLFSLVKADVPQDSETDTRGELQNPNPESAGLE